MSPLKDRRHRPGRHLAAAVAAGVAAGVVVATASVAIATGGFLPDGSPAAPAAPQPRALSGISCGSVISSVVKVQNELSEKSNTSFEGVPGATTTVTVPGGATRCIKVRFFAEAACAGSDSDYCYVRSLRNGVEMLPAGSGFQVLSSEDATSSGSAYQWVSRVGAGTHRITLQQKVGGGSTDFILDDWTFDVEVTN